MADAEKERLLVEAARSAFSNVRGELEAKGYGFHDYMHTGNEMAMGTMLGMKDVVLNFEAYQEDVDAGLRLLYADLCFSKMVSKGGGTLAAVNEAYTFWSTSKYYP